MTSIASTLVSSVQNTGIKFSAQQLTDEDKEKLKKLQEALYAQPVNTAAPDTSKTTDAPKDNNTVSGIETDRNRTEGRVATPYTQVAAQSIGGGDDTDTLGKSSGMSVEDQFLQFAGESWQDKVSDMILKSMGLTKEDLEKMSPEEREKVLAKIREKIKEEIEKKTGISQSADTADSSSAASAVSPASGEMAA